jgi:hypothetical protein
MAFLRRYFIYVANKLGGRKSAVKGVLTSPFEQK